MSAPSWKSLVGMSGLISSEAVLEIEDFEGDKDLLRVWAEGLEPDADLTVSQWADQYRMLASRASAEPGFDRPTRCTSTSILTGSRSAR